MFQRSFVDEHTSLGSCLSTCGDTQWVKGVECRGASRRLALGSSGWRPPTRISTGPQCGPPFLALAAVLCCLVTIGPADAPGRSAAGPGRAWSLLIGMGADRLCKTFGPCELFGSKRIALHFVRKMQNVWAKRFASKTFVEMSNVKWPFSTQSRTKCTKPKRQC